MVALLEAIHDDFVREIEQIRRTFPLCVEHPMVRGLALAYSATEDGCIVAVWDAWNRFMRELLLTCTEGEAIGLSAVRYVPRQPRSRVDAVAELRRRSRGTKIRFTRSEPNWYLASAVSDFTRILDISNASTIVAAVGSSSIRLSPQITTDNPLVQLRLVRNFIAHKNHETLADVQQLMRKKTSPYEFIHEPVIGGVERFDDWLDALIALAEGAAL